MDLILKQCADGWSCRLDTPESSIELSSGPDREQTLSEAWIRLNKVGNELITQRKGPNDYDPRDDH